MDYGPLAELMKILPKNSLLFIPYLSASEFTLQADLLLKLRLPLLRFNKEETSKFNCSRMIKMQISV